MPEDSAQENDGKEGVRKSDREKAGGSAK